MHEATLDVQHPFPISSSTSIQAPFGPVKASPIPQEEKEKKRSRCFNVRLLPYASSLSWPSLFTISLVGNILSVPQLWIEWYSIYLFSMMKIIRWKEWMLKLVLYYCSIGPRIIDCDIAGSLASFLFCCPPVDDAGTFMWLQRVNVWKVFVSSETEVKWYWTHHNDRSTY